jgi:sporulation and spore germination protein/immunoglobulin-like protein involved in spore germination
MRIAGLMAGLMVALTSGCGRQTGEQATRESGKTSLIRVTTPRPGETVTSPVEIQGEARGVWFFEASFPVRMLDAEGREIGVVPAQAHAEWMTESFVPFKAVLEFDPPPEGARGTLVLEKSNASGLPEHADEVRIPVIFGRTSDVEVYFSNPLLDKEPMVDCTAVFPVKRAAGATLAPARAALEALLAGPTPEERARGYVTMINDGVTLGRLVIENGVATADFSQELERTGGSCAVTAIRVQIERTLRQFPTVKSVRISIDGRTEDILQP